MVPAADGDVPKGVDHAMVRESAASGDLHRGNEDLVVYCVTVTPVGAQRLALAGVHILIISRVATVHLNKG